MCFKVFKHFTTNCFYYLNENEFKLYGTCTLCKVYIIVIFDALNALYDCVLLLLTILQIIFVIWNEAEINKKSDLKTYI